jgi:hypothetical protein
VTIAFWTEEFVTTGIGAVAAKAGVTKTNEKRNKKLIEENLNKFIN